MTSRRGTPLRAGTICVADLAASLNAYEAGIGYRTVETGAVPRPLAMAWGAPAAADAAYAMLQPASGAPTYLRLIEAAHGAGSARLHAGTTYGWAALEFCVQDVAEVARRLLDSPFRIIGPPRRLDGMEALRAMQVRGADGEICYFTQIDANPPGFTLPRAECLVDRLFIHVLAASDMAAAQRWIAQHVGLRLGVARMEMAYTVLAHAFGVAPDTRFTISTMGRGDETCLQVDQMPPAASVRPVRPGHLPPGIAMTTLSVADLDATAQLGLGPPSVHAGALYDGCRSVTVAGPDATLFELVEER